MWFSSTYISPEIKRFNYGITFFPHPAGMSLNKPASGFKQDYVHVNHYFSWTSPSWILIPPYVLTEVPCLKRKKQNFPSRALEKKKRKEKTLNFFQGNNLGHSTSYVNAVYAILQEKAQNEVLLGTVLDLCRQSASRKATAPAKVAICPF